MRSFNDVNSGTEVKEIEKSATFQCPSNIQMSILKANDETSRISAMTDRRTVDFDPSCLSNFQEANHFLLFSSFFSPIIFLCLISSSHSLICNERKSQREKKEKKKKAKKRKKTKTSGIPKTKGQRLQQMYNYFASRWLIVKRSSDALNFKKV